MPRNANRKGKPYGPRPLPPYPPSRITFVDETVKWADVKPLFVRIMHVNVPAGTRGDYSHPLPVLADNADGSKVTAHNYGAGPELECNCAGFDVGHPCQHVTTIQAKVRQPAAADAAAAADADADADEWKAARASARRAQAAKLLELMASAPVVVAEKA